MAPTLVASYNVVTSTVDTSTLTTPSFTPSNGEVIVVKATTWDSGTSMSTPTGGGQTFTKRSGSTSGGFRPYVATWTATVSGSPGSMTVSSTPSASSWHSMVVERWSAAQLAGSPIGDQADGAAAPASDTVASLTAGSIWSWVASDAQSVSPSGHAYLASATQELLDDQSGPANGVSYFAYQTATSGTNSYGLSTPSGMQFWIAGVEIQASAGGGTDHAGAVTPTVTATLTPAAAHGHAAAVSGTAVATLTPTPHTGRHAAVAATATAGLTPAATHVRTAAAGATAAATLVPAAFTAHPAAVDADATSTLLLSPSGQNQAAVTAAASAAFELATAHAHAAAVALNTAATLTVAAARTGTHAVTASVLARLVATIAGAVIRDITVTYGRPELAWKLGRPETTWAFGPPET